MEKLVSEVSSVDRSGAAQGLSEVFGALGVAKLDKSIPEIIERAEQTDLSPFVRDGYIMMFIYLPLTFTTEFTPYVGRILSPILKALADENEFVRDTALKAGQRIVNTYADTAISLFLPELEKGLFDSNWRIRYSSVQLLGDLLYKVSGVVGKMTTESLHEDDNFGTESGQKAIISRLGEERRNRVYAGLYMGRSDVSLFVRQAALHVWKVIVSNTPRTLKDILPTLFNLLLSFLASTNADKRQIAAATLVDIVRKLGERILPDIIPILENGLNSDRAEQRQGVCIGLTEIMSSTSKDNILFFSDSLIPTVRRALIDPLPEVRYYAAKTFDNLHNMIGTKALEEVGIYLLDEMKKADATTTDNEVIARSERALDGLKQIMMVKSRVMLPYLIPYLTQPPVNINVLCKLCGCASVDALSKHLSKILNTLVHALATMTQSNDWIRQECESLLLSIHDPDGVRTIVNELLHYLTHNQGTLGPNKTDNANTIVNDKLAVLDMLNWFCAKTKADYTNHVDDLIRTLLNLFADPNDSIVLKAWDCLNSVMDSLKGNALIQRLPIVRQSMRLIIQQNNLTSGGTTKKVFLLRGFCITKKGISCILPIFKEGLLNGTPDLKEQSALTLCECIKVSDSESLKSTVMTITGPLIRVLGERYSWNVKSAVLDAIYNLLLKVDVVLKPFLPQLQPTFLKALNDPNRTVRLKSGYALSKLVFMNPKFDQIVVEVNNYIKNTDDSQVKETLFNALRLCLNNIGGKLHDDTKKQLLNTLKQEQYLYSDDQQIRVICAGCLSSLAIHLNDQDFDSLLTDILGLVFDSSNPRPSLPPAPVNMLFFCFGS
jgi:HEAT repeat protein